MIDETIITKIWRIAFKIGKEKLNLTKTLYISCDYERTKKAGHILKIPGLGLFCDYRFIILDCRQINALHYFKDQRRWKSCLINCQFIPDLSGYLLYDLPQPPPCTQWTVCLLFTPYLIDDDGLAEYNVQDLNRFIVILQKKINQQKVFLFKINFV